MFPSSTSDPFLFDTDLTTSKHQALPPPPPSFSFFHFEDHEQNHIFLPNSQNHIHNHDLLLHQTLSLAEEAGGGGIMEGVKEQISGRSKRICKRDRHSKIKTAKGLRDRRMRLSLEVAKRFFGLQDMLGFDKASKTVEWLLNQSKDEIKQLAIEKNYSNNNIINSNCCVVKSASSSSECEGVSGLDEVAFINGEQEQEREREREPLLVKRRAAKGGRKILAHPIVARESREKARERARERTKEKERMKMMKSRKLLPPPPGDTTHQHHHHHNYNLTQFGSWNPFETGADEEYNSGCGTQNQKPNNIPNSCLDGMDEAADQEQPSSEAKDDDSLVFNLSKWSPSVILSSFNTSAAFLQEVSLKFRPTLIT